MNVLLVDAGLSTDNYSSGLVSVFPGAQGPCYACRKGRQRRRELLQELHGQQDPCWLKERRHEVDGFITTTPLMASIIAAIQVEVGLRHRLSASAHPNPRAYAVRIALTPDPVLERFDFLRSSSCPLHERDMESAEPRLVELGQAKSRELTVTDLLAGIKPVGPTGRVLCLDWPVVARAECLDCSHPWEPMWRRARFRNKASCPSCSSRRLVEREILTSVEASSVWASKKLTELGLPLLHVHEVTADNGEVAEKLYLEITGDLADLRLAEMAVS